MAVSRLTQTTLQNGFEKFNRIWDERSAVGSMEVISAVTLSAAQSSVDFNNIPGTYSHLQIRCFSLSTDTGAGGVDNLVVSFNGDRTHTNYRSHYLNGNGSAAAAGTIQTSTYYIYVADMANSLSSNTQTFGSGVTDILDYSSTVKNKTVRSLSGADRNGSGSVQLLSGLWLNTAAITSITIGFPTANMAANSSFTLYGIK